MKSRSVIAAALAIGMLAPLFSATADDGGSGIGLPGIPLRLTDPGPEKANPPDPAARNVPTPAASVGQRQEEAMTLQVAPGVNEIIVVSRGHLNRLVTPFEHPVVKTVSKASTQVEGNIVYVASESEEPVTLFINDEEDAEVAISLTLVPKAVPPREVRLSFDAAASQNLPLLGMGKARRWEQAQPYVQTLKDLMRDLALGEIPEGYNLRKLKMGDPMPRCEIPEIKITPGQILEGFEFRVIVSRVTNGVDYHIEFDETKCYEPGVAAVAVWPNTVMGPGESTELYYVIRRERPEERRQARPSLLGE